MCLDESQLVSEGGNILENVTTQHFAPRLPLPQMREDNIEAYFYSLNFWFDATGIMADVTKFNIVLASVPPPKLMELRTIIDAAPRTNKYGYIRTKLLENFTESQQRRLQRVLREMPLGERRPSDLYNEMKRAAGTTLSESILHDLWITRLPTYTQAAIIATNVSIVEKLKIADSITESIKLRQGETSEVCTVQQCTEQDLRAEVAALRQRLDQLLTNHGNRSRARSRTPAGNRDSHNPSNETCWYHTKFGRNARKCRQPCMAHPQSSTDAK
ncbi:uncharacterized protein LOC128922426 [Zeugodacus cucurbitae]|uniref:uncharacterized protein LOC128922426 n=1 Tax=Zeugodacus cucurbitae TaxID=28588 RepID=UPI0023D9389B|nr:uncharacterized protein LOC128922426 [Zeugodacus cucurbitae]